MSPVRSADVLASIQEPMAATERELAALLSDDSAALAGLSAHLEKYAGKRLRPALVHLSASLLGTPNDDHVAIGAVIEALHMASLLHDDVLDEADVRRGASTLNALHGNQVPVLLGDFVYARAFSRTLDLSTLEAARVLAAASQDVCRGEIEQSYFRAQGAFDEQAYFGVIRGKTAALFGAAGRLGVSYAGGAAEQAAAMERFGLQLGMAFQIIDDCLDVVGDEDVVGKSLGTDLETGKLTLPVIKLATSLSGARFERFTTLLRGEVAGSRREALTAEFDLTDAIAQSEVVADEFVRDCQSLLEDFPKSAARTSLYDICAFVLARSS